MEFDSKDYYYYDFARNRVHHDSVAKQVLGGYKALKSVYKDTHSETLEEGIVNPGPMKGEVFNNSHWLVTMLLPRDYVLIDIGINGRAYKIPFGRLASLHFAWELLERTNEKVLRDLESESPHFNKYDLRDIDSARKELVDHWIKNEAKKV